MYQKLCAIVLLLSCATLCAQEGKRVALIIGNDAYSVKPLKNAVNDARAMDKALRAAGFRTIVRENADKIAMERAAVEFFQTLGPSDTGLFFYAGHAVQIENENVLIPTDFESSWTPLEARFRSFSLAMIYDSLKRSRAKTAIVIVDACRVSPVAEAHSLAVGLSMPMNAGKETYTAYSTSPNHVATDNPDGINSWFTEALVELITKPGLTLDEVFTGVRMRVEKATAGGQTPWSQTSLTNKFYFVAPKNLEASFEPDLPERLLADALRRESAGDYEASAGILKRVLGMKPSGSVEQLAKSRLPIVAARQQAAADADAGKYSDAAKSYEAALKLDPFSFDSASSAVANYLLVDDLASALPVLRQMRQRGSSPVAAKADAILKELAPVSPEAAKELSLGIPSPPNPSELFPARRFGVPDFVAGERFVRQAPSADVSLWANRLPEPKLVTRPEPGVSTETAVTAAPAADPGILEAMHVHVASLAGARDLVNEELGELVIRGTQSTLPVVLNGRTVSRALPYRVKVPGGKYIVRTMDGSKIASSYEVEVKPGSVAEVTLK